MLPQDSEHNRFKVLIQVICDLDTVPFLQAVNPKHLQKSGGKDMSHRRDAINKHSSSLCIYLYSWKDISLLCLCLV